MEVHMVFVAGQSIGYTFRSTSLAFRFCLQLTDGAARVSTYQYATRESAAAALIKRFG